jgi:hypothetical protein
MAALVSCFFFGVVFGVLSHIVARKYYWWRAGKRWSMRMRYRRYNTTKHLRAIKKCRRYSSGRSRSLARILDRLEVNRDDSDPQL